jgi:diguanylate cyclase (GGDEF)-like protein
MPYLPLYYNWLSDNVVQPVRSALHLRPQELQDAFTKLDLLAARLRQPPPVEVEADLLPLLKRAIIHARRTLAFDVEKRSSFTVNHNVRVTLEEGLNQFSALMEQEWFKSTEIARSPKITDFLSIHWAEDFAKNTSNLQLAERDYDEKFHILNAPSLFIPDLVYYRAASELRGTPLCVAYIDIDDFKKFNTSYGEPRVDRDVLPKFMSALEAHIYAHGHSYRFGGDEYAVILPNASTDQAISFLASFQDKLRELDYFGIKERTEISVGIFEVNESSMQTDREIEERAAFAKNYAKKNGKNCIATYQGQSSQDKDLYVASNGHSKNG